MADSRQRFFIIKLFLGFASPMLVLFGIFLLFHAEVLHVKGVRTEQQTVTLHATHYRFWGLLTSSTMIDSVTGALTKSASGKRRASAIYITTQTSKRPKQLSPSQSSHVAEKQRLIRVIDAFLANPDSKAFEITLDFRGARDWIGLLMLIVGIYAIMYWSLPVVRDALEKRRQRNILDKHRAKYNIRR